MSKWRTKDDEDRASLDWLPRYKTTKKADKVELTQKSNINYPDYIEAHFVYNVGGSEVKLNSYLGFPTRLDKFEIETLKNRFLRVHKVDLDEKLLEYKDKHISNPFLKPDLEEVLDIIDYEEFTKTVNKEIQ